MGWLRGLRWDEKFVVVVLVLCFAIVAGTLLYQQSYIRDCLDAGGVPHGSLCFSPDIMIEVPAGDER